MRTFSLAARAAFSGRYQDALAAALSHPLAGDFRRTKTVLDALLEAHELIKGKVLESAMLTPRTVSEALCEATGAEPVQCIGSKFVVYRQARDKDKRKIVLVK